MPQRRRRVWQVLSLVARLSEAMVRQAQKVANGLASYAALHHL